MSRHAPTFATVVVLLMGLLALFWWRQTPGSAGATGPSVSSAPASHATATAVSPATGNRSRATASWKLPFRLKPRLTPEQAEILASGRVGTYLREHPQEDDLLTAWAAADPAAASAWLESAGEIVVDDVGYYFSHLAALAAGTFAHGGIAEMQALLEKHAQDPLLPPKYQDAAFASHPWFKLAREDTGAEALAYLQDHPEQTELAGAFLSGIDDTDRMLAALDYLHAKGVEVSPDYWQLSTRAEKDGALLADWAAGSRLELLQDILLGWNSSNPEWTRKWIDANASRPELARTLGEVRKVLEAPRE